MEKEEISRQTGIRLRVIEELTALADYYGIHQVILFGSRARGDYREKSDIDIAVTGGDIVNFSLDAEEKTNTLLQYDIVDMECVSDKEFIENISREGIMLYEKI